GHSIRERREQKWICEPSCIQFPDCGQHEQQKNFPNSAVIKHELRRLRVPHRITVLGFEPDPRFVYRLLPSHDRVAALIAECECRRESLQEWSASRIAR